MNRDSLYSAYRTFVQVDLNAIAHNGSVARRIFSQQKILSVLKADAYGHGISGVIPAYETFTDWYAVATFEEAMEIRQQSKRPVLLFGPVPKDHMVKAAENDITFTVGSFAYGEMLSRIMASAGLRANCHLKIDTGLNRSGVRWRDPDASMYEICRIRNLPNLDFSGTYTHLACGEGQLAWELEHTRLQMKRFDEACASMKKAGFPVGICHAASTGGALVHPEYRLDMVRLGMLPMGMSYCDESVVELGLVPALTWIGYLSQIEHVKAGEAVSYGCTFRAQEDMTIGIITCGYADGYRRAYSGKTHVLIGGKRIPVVGRIAMDYTMVDLSDISDPKPGMAVTMLGSDGDSMISAQELSAYGESVSGEVTCAISKRVPRFYIGMREGKEDV